MEAIPSWLIDAVAAAGLTTAYADQYDTLIEQGVRRADAPQEAAGPAH